MARFLQHLWNTPNSLLGLLGSVGGMYVLPMRDGALEVSGGWLIVVLERWGWATAITLGEVILYRDEATRREWSAHERVHVRQGRRWGLLFLPAYVLESAYQWLRTGDGYTDNRFERQAYGK